jgi:hypothetical protein
VAKRTTYEDLVKHNSKIADILDPDVYEFMYVKNQQTVKLLSPTWEKNARINIKRYYKRYGLFVDNCKGFGLNKAVIGIGAGPSLKKNWDFLKKLNRWNWDQPIDLQPFVFMVSNHQFKPCLEAGIVPHFVILVDAGDSDAIYNQMCKDIPPIAKGITLLCATHINPELLREWREQGRLFQFYVPDGDDNKEFFDKVIGEEVPENKKLPQGGNVMNVAWVASLVGLQSTIFISLGNDLSYDLNDSLKKRREGYYADGDYSSNLQSGRDEASGIKKWIGFEMSRNPFTEKAQYKFVPKGTTGSLFTYKEWFEVFIAIQDMSPQSFHYYNCSESGILGVVPKSYKKIDMDDIDNWQLLDEILPNRYHTRLFKDVASDIITFKEIAWHHQKGILTGADLVTGLRERIIGANCTVHPLTRM